MTTDRLLTEVERQRKYLDKLPKNFEFPLFNAKQALESQRRSGYRNTAAAWTNFVWPSPQGAPGVKISGVSFDGRSVEFINFPGNFGLEKMLGSAARKKLDATTFELKWTSSSGANLVVPVKLRIISSPGVNAPAAGQPASNGGTNFKGLQLPTLIAGDDGAPAPTASPGSPPTTVAATEPHH